MSVSVPPNSETCLVCAHYLGDKIVEVGPGIEGDHILYCKAYPNGIPDEITDGRVKHRTHHVGDNGIVFEPIDNQVES